MVAILKPVRVPRFAMRRSVQAASFLLLTGCLGLWALSYVAADRVVRFGREATGSRYVDTTLTLTSNRGRLAAAIERTSAGGFTADEADLLKRFGVGAIPPAWTHASGPAAGSIGLPVPRTSLREKWQFRWGRQQTVTAHGDYRAAGLEIPCWALALPAVLLNAYVFRKALRRFRHLEQVRRRICTHCGYDLRASRGRCPECGKGILVLIEDAQQVQAAEPVR